MRCNRCDDEKPDAKEREKCQQQNCKGEYLPDLPEDSFLAMFTV